MPPDPGWETKMEDILSYQEFCQQRGLDQSKPETLHQYTLYFEVAEFAELQYLEDFLNQGE